MRRKLNEENYNQVIELGTCSDLDKVSEVIYRLKEEGIEAYNKGNKVIISVEQDRNNPHYVDDIREYAMNIFNNACRETGKMKLACSKNKTVKLTESKLKNMIKEAVHNALKEL